MGNKTERSVYGAPDTPESKKRLEDIWTLLDSNARVARRLANALGLKALPGHPTHANLKDVGIQADFFQAGFANMRVINPPAQTSDFVGTGANLSYATGIFASPLKSQTPNLNNLFLPRDAMVKNNLDDMRISNAWVKYFPTTSNLNPNTDTNPLAIHVQFLLDGGIVYERVQDNLICSAADFSFVSQTVDCSWNGIVPAGSTFSWKMFLVDGTDGTAENFGEPNGGPGDSFQMGMIALACPFGAQLPL